MHITTCTLLQPVGAPTKGLRGRRSGAPGIGGRFICLRQASRRGASGTDLPSFFGPRLA